VPSARAQVLALRQRGINANYLASTQTDRRACARAACGAQSAEKRRRLFCRHFSRVRSSVAGDAAAGRIDLLYVSPERAMVLGAAFFAGLMRGRCATPAP
jgi:superfamily II DNA helicase RecQ